MNNTGTNINDDKNKALAKVKQKFAKIEGLFDHPSEDISIAGEAIQPLPSIFHGLLQTVSDLMLLLPVSNAIVVTLIAMFMQFWLSVFVVSQRKLYIHKSYFSCQVSKGGIQSFKVQFFMGSCRL